MSSSFRNFLNLVLVGALATGNSFSTFAQDFTFSQTSQLRQVTNPARIGSFREDYRVSGGYRNQWYAAGNPYQVLNLNAELNFLNQPLGLDKLGTLIGVVQDNVGGGAVKTTYLSAGISAFKSLDATKRHQVSFGVLGSLQMRELNPGSFTYNNQFDPVSRVFDGSLSSGEVFGSKRQTFFQVSVGAAYFFHVSELMDLQVNGSFIGLNSIQATFSTLPDVGNSAQKRRFTLGFEGRRILNERLSIEPSVYYNRQGPAQEIVAGSWVELKPGKFRISPGLFYRINDAIIPAVRVEMNNWVAALSYDITHTTATEAANNGKLVGLGGFGALEFTISHKGIFRKKTGTRLAIPCRTF